MVRKRNAWDEKKKDKVVAPFARPESGFSFPSKCIATNVRVGSKIRPVIESMTEEMTRHRDIYL